MTRRINLYVDQGTDFSTPVNIYADARQVSDIQNHFFSSDAKKAFSSSQKVFSFTVNKTGVSNNRVVMSLTANNIIPPGKYQYDLIMTSPNNSKSKIVEGLVYVIETMTSANT